MKKELNQVDLCFVVDTTGSMSPFINAAREALLETISTLSKKSGVDLQIGLVEYRDHPPEEMTYVTKHHALTSEMKKMEKVIAGLYANGGGDAPEAVYDGVCEAAVLTDWREHSQRFIMLVGDAPPQGYDVRRENLRPCTCGLEIQKVTASAEENRVLVHALPMTNEAATIAAFTEIARGTGGTCAETTNANLVVKRIEEMLDTEFQNLQFDGKVLEIVTEFSNLETEAISQKLECTRLQAAASIARLGRRGFLGETHSNRFHQINLD